MRSFFYIHILFSILTITTGYSQIDNPFRSIGKEGEIITLSKGKYQEVHLYDSLQKIGSVIVNMNTGMIYKIVDTDTMYSEATLDPTIISRWYSPDPLQAKYPGWSPYNFANNNPIFFIDPDGRDVVPGSTFINQQQLYAVFQIFNKTDVYAQLTAAFSVNNLENLKFIYLENKPEIAIASAEYLPTSAEKTSYTHAVIFYSLVQFIPSGDKIVEAEKTYNNTFLSGVLAHELIHSNMNRAFNAGVDITEIEKNFPGISDFAKRFPDDNEKAQHEYMAVNSRSLIASAMKQTDLAQSSPVREDKWYDAVAWTGLTHHEDGTETEAWTNYKKTASNDDLKYTESVLTSSEVKGVPIPKTDEK